MVIGTWDNGRTIKWKDTGKSLFLWITFITLENGKMANSMEWGV